MEYKEVKTFNNEVLVCCFNCGYGKFKLIRENELIKVVCIRCLDEFGFGSTKH